MVRAKVVGEFPYPNRPVGVVIDLFAGRFWRWRRLIKHAKQIFYDCIIGGGPAGLVASVYLRWFRRSVLVFDRGDSRVKPIPKIRNLIGYADGISGKQLLHRLYKQAHMYVFLY